MVIKVYDVETNTIKKNIIIPQELKFIYSMTWSPDNEWIALGTWNGIYKMSVKTGEISLLTEESNQVNFWYIVKE
jgi:tricorn protease-like protein